ncbi:MAG: hypothetical protein SOW24_00895 [Eubacteriales bacterium]|nr:hypothetical protein [Eubacteriales bacterium]
MERLTNKREADAQREEYKRRLANKYPKYPRNIQEEQFLRLAAYEDTGLEPEEIKELLHDTTGPLHHKLGEWIDADASSRLVVLQCKVGDTVWQLKKKCKYAGENDTPWDSCNQYWDNVYQKNMWGCAGKDDKGKRLDCEKRDMEWYAQQIEYSLVLYSPNIVLGKNLFLTREEAEAALKGGDDNA